MRKKISVENIRDKLFRLILSFLIILNIYCKKSPEEPEPEPEPVELNWDVVEIDHRVPLIADLRNDGIERSYIIEPSGDVLECYFPDGGWARTKLGWLDLSLASFQDSMYLHIRLGAAKCYEDGKSRLYVIANDGIYEFENMGATWSNQLIYSGSIAYWHGVTSGDTRNEGFESLYFIEYESGYGSIVELSFRDGIWTTTYINSTPISSLDGLAIGDVKGINKNCVYAITGHTEVMEFEFMVDSLWTCTAIDTLGIFNPYEFTGVDISILPIHNGQVSLFAEGGGLYELIFQDGHWEKIKIHDLGPAGPQLSSELKGGEGHNDGIYRLYFPFGSKIYEISFGGDSWIQTDVIKLGDWICGLTVGPGRGDGINRIYVGEYNAFYRIYVGTFELTFKQ